MAPVTLLITGVLESFDSFLSLSAQVTLSFHGVGVQQVFIAESGTDVWVCARPCIGAEGHHLHNAGRAILWLLSKSPECEEHHRALPGAALYCFPKLSVTLTAVLF